jgi:hypothetical protein
MSQALNAQMDPIPYATPVPRERSRVTPAVWLAVIGLALIGLGGCFLIRVMSTLIQSGVIAHGPGNSLSASRISFITVLYVCAFGCFGGALLMLFKGIRVLFALVMN